MLESETVIQASLRNLVPIPAKYIRHLQAREPNLTSLLLEYNKRLENPELSIASVSPLRDLLLIRISAVGKNRTTAQAGKLGELAMVSESPKCSSEGKGLANRQNAGNSTGPKTGRGKKTVSLNPCKHSLTSSRLVLTAEEDSEEMAQLLRSLDSAGVQNALDPCCLPQLVCLMWKQHKIQKMRCQLLLQGADVRRCSLLTRYERSVLRQLRRLDSEFFYQVPGSSLVRL